MQPLTLSIPGKFWDSYIYRGRLFLFGLEGDIRTISWDALLESWPIAEKLRLPLDCAFLRSDFLYGQAMQRMFRDPEVRNLVKIKFRTLGKEHLEASEQRLRRCELGRQDNPLPFPHADAEIYDRSLYVTGPFGLVRATAAGQTKHPISTRPDKKWDAPVYRVAAAWGHLALAAGDEGLFELSVDYEDWVRGPHDDPPQVSARRCNDCSWAYYSIFGSSDTGGFLAAYEKRQHPEFNVENRQLASVLPSEDLWTEEGYSWGVQDKLCLASDTGIHVLKYEPWHKEPAEVIRDLGTVSTPPRVGQVLSASAAPFGLVVELEEALVVYPSSGKPVVLKGEPVNWRVFTRAKHYQNQLHVIWPDRLEILSFNHDYLVDQEDKLLGVSVLGLRESKWVRTPPGLPSNGT